MMIQRTEDWLKDLYVTDPPSAEIAERLEAEGATDCEHNRNPCIMRCGVRCEVRYKWFPPIVNEFGTLWMIDPVPTKIGPWQVIPTDEREEWHRRWLEPPPDYQLEIRTIVSHP